MDIAAMAMSLSQINIQNQVSIDLMGKVMDNQKLQAATLLEGMQKSTPVPSFGHVLDTYA